MVPAFFRRFPSMPDIFTSSWKARRWCVRMFTKMMVHFYLYAGTGVAPGTRKPTPSAWSAGLEPA